MVDIRLSTIGDNNMISTIENQVDFIQKALEYLDENSNGASITRDHLCNGILYDENGIVYEYFLFLTLECEIEDFAGFLTELLGEYSEDKIKFILNYGKDPFYLKSFSDRHGSE